MAKLQSFASPLTLTDAGGSSKRDTHQWEAQLKARPSVFGGAVHDAGRSPVPQSAKAYYFGVSEDSRTRSDDEPCADLREIEASLLKALASEHSSDASARLRILLEEVQIRIRDIRG